MTLREPERARPTIPAHALPQWEISRRQRLQLDRRVRQVRRTLLTGGVVGTVAFSLLAGYHSRNVWSTSAASAPTPTPIVTDDGQPVTSGFFDGQTSTIVTPTPTDPASPSTPDDAVTDVPTPTPEPTEADQFQPDQGFFSSGPSQPRTTSHTS